MGKWKASINGFLGANYVRHVDCRKSIFRSTTNTWISRLHKSVALFTKWADYVVTTKACTKGCKDSRFSQRPSPILRCVSQSSIMLAWNLAYHARMKLQIHVKYYFIRDVLNNKGIKPFKEHNDDNSKNHIFLKILTQPIHEWMAQICRYIQLKSSDKGSHYNHRMTL